MNNTYCNNNGECPPNGIGAAAHLFASSLQFFAAAQCLIKETWPPDASVTDYEEFDFIIVGAGSAGSVLANRLSEVAEWNVLLIEAGGDPPAESIIPVMAESLHRTAYDWDYQTSNDGTTSQGCLNSNTIWPRGKMLGGSSSINGMFYCRGNHYDYLKWNSDLWLPRIVQKYFNKAENLIKTLKNNSIPHNYYGHNGPLDIGRSNDTYPIINKKVLESWNELGIHTVPDLNVANMLGSGVSMSTIANGERISTAVAYLIPAQNRPNLKIIKKSLVTKILIKDDVNEAYGVEVDRDGGSMTFLARKEVILSAGTVNSPQILLLSGIGPEQELKPLGVNTKVHLPAVGKNLMDHLIIYIFINGNNSASEAALTYMDGIKYLNDRSGFLAHGQISNIVAFWPTSLNNSYPHFQSHFVITERGSPLIGPLVESIYTKSIANEISANSKLYSTYVFSVILLHPLSKGNISLSSLDPKDHPIIYPNYFTNSEDLDKTVAAIKFLTKIVNTKYFKSIGAHLQRIKWKPCNGFELDSVEYWKCIARNIVQTIYHPIGSCKMGINPNASVVDHRLRVHRISKLRVVDASVMPSEISCNTNGPVIMLAERAADLIKEEYTITN